MEKKGFFEKIKKEYSGLEIICVISSVLLALAVGTYAWFSSNGLRYFFGVKPVTQAYTLYLTDSRDNRPLELRTKIPPNIDSKQEFVFKVKSRSGEEDVENERLDYELEMNFTENLPVIYNLYKYSEADGGYVLLDSYDDITDERREQAYGSGSYNYSWVISYNQGRYRRYHNTDSNAYFTLWGAPDVYKIEILWDLNRVNNIYDLNEYNKETDLIYIVAREISTENNTQTE